MAEDSNINLEFMDQPSDKGFGWVARCWFNVALESGTAFGLVFGSAYAIQFVLMKYFFRPKKWVPGFIRNTTRSFGRNVRLINSTIAGTCVGYEKMSKDCKLCTETWRS